ncbi:hypothetical protein BDV95DRAFT_506623 [Massariosphaeria phaeospora]|uniref:rRNA biogenesis protein RRP36 n=1 Tax=Massariosphaeria phaeospora TaxID=100035 RepID=A0A7C8M2H1_9PLEO|nr:hypothetical protein BDV95DRAFT_506623 [Massariosphaeria phaeospora]
MPLSSTLDRKIRAAAESSDDEEYYEVTDRSSPSVLDTGDGAEILSSENGDTSEDGEEEDVYEQQMSKVSFGELAKAQAALSDGQSTSRKRKRGDGASAPQEDKLQALRARLQELKAQNLAQGVKPNKKAKPSEKPKSTRKAEEDGDDDLEGESSDPDRPTHARTSKHAPAVQSSKRAVSRKRKALEVKKPVLRDPRFDNVSGPRPDENVIKKRYGFIDDYRVSEIADLRAAVKKSKNEIEKERLKKKLLSMESQQKARESKEKQQEIKHEHKKQEKELIKDGKKPFFLKKSEQKKLALIDRFQNMKAKDRDRAIERRRKKTASKDRRNIPVDRRAG